MKINRTKNASRNIIWGFIEKIASVLLPFVTRSVLIHTLGAEYLGLSSLFVSILSVLSISELGFGSAIVFSMYKPIAEDDNETLCALLNIYRKVYHWIGTIILVIGLILTPFIPKLINGDVPGDINIFILYFVYLLNTVISYYLYAYKAALFSAHQRNDLSSKTMATVNLISNILKIVVLLVFKNYYVYVLVIPLATIITNFANAYLAKKYYPNIICKGDISKEVKDEIKKRILGLVSFKIYNVIFASVDTIVISSFLGLVPLAIYNNYYYIQTSIIGFLTIITSSITAGVGNKMITNSIDDNYKDFKNFAFLNGWICSWCAVCMLCLYQHFMQWWMGEDLLFTFDTMVLMVLYFLLPRITTMSYTYREAAGLWWEDRFRPLVATVVNLVANLILVQVIGMNGVIISTLICTIFINVPWGTTILFKNYFKRSLLEYFGQIIYYVFITVIAGILTLCVCELLPNMGFGFMIVKGMICVIIPNIIFLLCYHKMPEFQYAKQLMSRILKKL